ncbi:MAG: acyl--CoA ligase [Pseudomonadota bacterium]|nr:acyl--CoA ligase [Pseudomonadota bacterium]
MPRAACRVDGRASSARKLSPVILRQLIASQPPEALALGAPGRRPLTHGQLLELIDHTGRVLAGHSIGRHDTLAIVLPNGPEMAAFFLAAASACATAPLNPAYLQEEFAFYLADLGAKALVAETGSDGPAVAAARQLGIPILEIDIDPRAPAGTFAFAAPKYGSPATPTADDIALLLHTSGTTARPKLVPLSHANLLASAANIAGTLRLESEDRCLNIMPLFHIHGLAAAVLASLSAGASVHCTPGFNALRFFAWLADVRPTWYTAVPTMHQAILSRAAPNRAAITANPLKFIRSSSASLPAAVLAELEGTFGCPVIEAYSMTEAAHQMTSNQLPPGKRKAGSVGIGAGPQVAVMSGDGRILSGGEIGEVVVRGANVTRGYLGNAAANDTAFAHGWFHTGDQGVFDGDGFLRITGRLKEIINRGGEKVAPVEIDDALLGHAAVHQAVAFAMPHAKLGEEVAAAVVLREGAEASEQELRDYLLRKLAPFKVPRRIVIVDDIPKSATGKLQRQGLAQKLGLAG